MTETQKLNRAWFLVIMPASVECETENRPVTWVNYKFGRFEVSETLCL